MTTWSISQTADTCGLSHTLRWLSLITRLRQTGMTVSDMQRECLKLLDSKIDTYSRRLREASERQEGTPHAHTKLASTGPARGRASPRA